MLFAPRMVGKLADRWGTTRAVIPAMLCFALSFWVISYSDSLPLFLLAAVISAFGYGAAQPAVQALGMKSVLESRRGSASSTSYIGQDLGNLVGPIVAGWLVERLGYRLMWRMMILPVLAAILLVILFRKKVVRIEERFQQQVSENCC